MKKTTLLITLIGAFAAGCYSVNTVQNTDTTAQVHPVADRRIVWDETLAGKLDIGTIIESNVGGLRKIEVPLTNRYAYQQDLVYQFDWELMASSIPASSRNKLHLRSRTNTCRTRLRC